MLMHSNKLFEISCEDEARRSSVCRWMFAPWQYSFAYDYSMNTLTELVCDVHHHHHHIVLIGHSDTSMWLHHWKSTICSSR